MKNIIKEYAIDWVIVIVVFVLSFTLGMLFSTIAYESESKKLEKELIQLQIKKLKNE